MTLEIGRAPTLIERPFSGGRVKRLWEGRRNVSGAALEISEVGLDQASTPSRLRRARLARRGQSARPVILAAAQGDRWHVCGPQGSPPPVVELSGRALPRDAGAAVPAVVHPLREEEADPATREARVARAQRDAVAVLYASHRLDSSAVERAVEALSVPWPRTVSRALRAILDGADRSDESKAEQIAEYVSAEGLRPPDVSVEPPITQDDGHLVRYQVVGP